MNTVGRYCTLTNEPFPPTGGPISIYEKLLSYKFCQRFTLLSPPQQPQSVYPPSLRIPALPQPDINIQIHARNPARNTAPLLCRRSQELPAQPAEFFLFFILSFPP